MTVSETIKELQNNTDYVEYQIYAYKDRVHKEHGDFITDDLNEMYSIEYLKDKEVLHYEIMDEERYNETILANCCVDADFEGWYGTKDAKVLVLFLSESWDEEEEESEEDLDKKNMIDQLYSLPGFETELSKKDMANKYTKAEIIDMLDAYDLEFSDAEYDGTILEITPSQHKEITARIERRKI